MSKGLKILVYRGAKPIAKLKFPLDEPIKSALAEAAKSAQDGDILSVHNEKAKTLTTYAMSDGQPEMV